MMQLCLPFVVDAAAAAAVDGDGGGSDCRIAAAVADWPSNERSKCFQAKTVAAAAVWNPGKPHPELPSW